MLHSPRENSSINPSFYIKKDEGDWNSIKMKEETARVALVHVGDC